MIELGQEAKDIVTGFKGILIGRAQYLTGCDQYCIKPKIKKDGSDSESAWFDEGRIRIVGKGVRPESVRVAKNGGPVVDAPKGMR